MGCGSRLALRAGEAYQSGGAGLIVDRTARRLIMMRSSHLAPRVRVAHSTFPCQSAIPHPPIYPAGEAELSLHPRRCRQP